MVVRGLKDYTKIQSDNSDFTAEDIYAELEELSNDSDVLVLDARSGSEKQVKGIVSRYNDEPYIGQYIGFLRVKDKDKDHTFFINSRFDNDKQLFSNYILDKALGIKSAVFADMNVQMSQDRFMEVLLGVVFMNQIKNAYKSGLYRQYKTFQNNDMKVKGSIDIARHIKQNPIFNGRIAYSYREYTPDNDINRIILTAYEMISKKNGQLVKKLAKKYNIDACIKQLKNVTTVAGKQEIRTLIKRNNKKIQHSVYKNWESVRKTAIMILRHMGVYNDGDASQEVSGILVDMPSMWESYLEEVMNEHGCKVEPQKETKVLLDGNKSGKRIFKPDFFIEEKSDGRTIVLDAKYKAGWSEIAAKPGKGWDDSVREDIFQVMAYMYALGAQDGGIICPVVGGQQDQKYVISGVNDDKFHLLSFLVSKSDNISEFCQEMKKSEKDFAERIKALIKGENDIGRS